MSCKRFSAACWPSPEQRYARPAELIGELLRLRDRLGLASLAAASQGHVPPENLTWRQRAMAWAIPLAMMLLLVVGWELFLSGGYTTANNPPEFRIPVQEGAAAVPRSAVGDDNTQSGSTANSTPGDDGAEVTPAAGGGKTLPEAASPAPTNATGASNETTTSSPPPAEGDNDRESVRFGHDNRRSAVVADHRRHISVARLHAGHG